MLVDLGHAHEERRRKWLAQYDAQTDYDEFMISSSASLACDVERSRRVCAADVEIKSEAAEADDTERADELGDLLFLHPAGPTALYGIDPVPPDTSAPSRNRKASDPNKPSRIVRRLEKTSAGCEFLLREWKRLRALAETGFWLAPDRFRAARMLGRQPVDALEHREVAMIFVASRGIIRLGKSEFDDLRGDMNEHALDLFMLRVKARFSDLFHESTAAEYRKMLIDLADEHITRLTSKCARHIKKATANAARTIDKLGEDQSSKGASATQLELKCMNTIKRLMAPYQKEREDKPKGGGRRAAGCPDEGRKARGEWRGGGGETCGRGYGGVRDPRRTCGGGGGVGEETCGRDTGGVRDPRRTEGGGGGEPSGGRDPRRARADEWERVESQLDESDIRACGGFLPVGRTGLASATLETEDRTGLAGGTLGQTEDATGLAGGTLDQAENGTEWTCGALMESSAGAVDVGGDDRLGEAVIADCGEAVRVRRPPTAACGGTSPTSSGEGAGDESVTNEPEPDEEVKSSNYITHIGITTNSGVGSGLDKRGIDGDFDGGELVRMRRPPTAACGGTSPTGGEGMTNEPEIDEEVKSSNYITYIGITTNSGVDSGLDKGGIDGDFDGGETDCGEAFRECRPPTAACGGTSRASGDGASGESVTNEPESDEEVQSSNYIANIGITANSGVDSGLDKGGIDSDFDGGKTDCGEAFRECRPPTAACGGTSPTRGEGKQRSVGEVAPTQSVGARGIENSTSESGETSDAPRAGTADCGDAPSASGEDEEAELRELQAQLAIETVKRQARAGPMADAIKDLLASSPEAMEVLKPFLPRGP